MATLDDLRNKVRSQTETQTSEIDNPTIDSWLQEAYNRTISAERDWPFFEHVWEVQQAVGNAWAPEPTDLADVVSLIEPSVGVKIPMLTYDTAESMFLGAVTSSSTPQAFSRWNGQLVFWPAVTFDEIVSYTLRGYRKPSDWIAGGAGAEPDCDSRLHLALANYAIALAYAQQEDMELERQYMDRWQRDVELAHRMLMEPNNPRPMVMGKRVVTRIGRTTSTPPFVVDVP